MRMVRKAKLSTPAARRAQVQGCPPLLFPRLFSTGSGSLYARNGFRVKMSRHPGNSPSSTPLQRGASLSPAMSSPRSNRSSFSSSPYTSHPRLSIRTPRMGQPAPTILDHLVAPLKRGRSRRLVLLLAFASFVGLLVWRSSEDLAGPAANEDRACRLLPWLRRCIGTGSHPLDLIHFERVRRVEPKDRPGCRLTGLLPTVRRLHVLPRS